MKSNWLTVDVLNTAWEPLVIQAVEAAQRMYSRPYQKEVMPLAVIQALLEVREHPEKYETNQHMLAHVFCACRYAAFEAGRDRFSPRLPRSKHRRAMHGDEDSKYKALFLDATCGDSGEQIETFFDPEISRMSSVFLSDLNDAVERLKADGFQDYYIQCLISCTTYEDAKDKIPPVSDCYYYRRLRQMRKKLKEYLEL